jgi:YidC/Oxa1 family membrane protein insertase
MEGNKRTLALLVIAIAIGALYFVTTQLMAPEGEPGGEAAETAQVEGEGESEDGAPAGEGEAAEDEESPAAELSPEEREALRETVTLRGENYEAVVDNLGGGLQHVYLVGDERFTDEYGQPMDVVTTDREEYEPLRVQLGDDVIPDDAVWDLEQVSEREVRLTWEGEGYRVVRTLSAGEGPYQLWSTTRVVNTADHAQTTRLAMAVWHYVTRESESGGIIASRSPYISHGVCVYGDETERKDREKLVEEGAHGYGDGNVHVAAVENVYFTQAMAAHEDPAARCGLYASNRGGTVEDPHGTLFESRLLYPWEELEPGGERVYQTLGYLGPKDRDALNLAGHQLPEMVDLGFFALIARQLARFLSFIHQFVPNWGLAIILLTVIIRLTLFPLTNLSFKSMARMRQLKPEIDRINELYKDDAEKKGAAIMELYRKHKINPLSGCLPSLLQLPVWWALYTSLSTNIELYHMPFILWWTDLSSPDPFYVLPVMLGGLMHLQQRLSPTTMDPTQAKMMMYFMPIMITVFMLFLPSGLCLYMLTNSALGIGQQKLNEYRLAKQPAIEVGGDGGDDGEPGDEGAGGDEDVSPEKPQKRRPRRKRRVRRGRA